MKDNNKLDSILLGNRKVLADRITSGKSLKQIVYHKKGKFSKQKVMKIAGISFCLVVSVAFIVFAVSHFSTTKTTPKIEKVTINNKKKKVIQPTESKAIEQVLGTTVVADVVQPIASGNNFVTSDYYLTVPKLNVIGNVLETDLMAKVNDILQNGIVHLPGTVNPGEVGNTIFTAHSSYYNWDYYSHIFAKLDELENGDAIILNKGKSSYVYKVFNKDIIIAKLQAVKYTAGEENIVLLTCWPVGTSDKRLAIYAKRVK